MKIFMTLTLLAALADAGTVEAQRKNNTDSVRVTIHLDNALNHHAPVDSVLVIFDRYNLTGAGVIKKVFYPANNKVVIENVPEGKYYITVMSMGLFRKTFSEVSYVYEHRKNNNEFSFQLPSCDNYQSGTAYIPAEKIDPQQLVIFKRRLRR